MANTISVMTNAVRGVVSKKRIRYQENGYDLDLAYVGDKLIAMGYPAENIESIFRNKIEHVYGFLEEKHKDHYKIYNLCSERHYDGNRFHGRVALYPFDDHNPPPIRLIKEFCDDVDAWLKADKENVAAVHCKAGKGRTGTMICCYLLHCRMKTTAESALTFYDEKRTKNKKGVTIPSQRRYVEYYAKLVNSGQPYEDRTLQICGIKISPQLSNQDNIHCSIYPNPRSEDAESIHTTLSFRKTQLIEINDRCIPLTGDVKIEFYRKVMKRKERYFHFWFNTYFICDKAAAYEDGEGEKKFVYELTKYELDDAHKDTEHKSCPQDFKVQLVFKPVEKDYNMTTPSAAPNLASVTNVVNNSNVKSNYANLIPLNQEQNHHHLNYNQSKLPNNVGMNHNNSVLMVNSRPLSSKEPPFARDPVRVSLTDSSTSGSSIGDQQHNRMMMPSQSSSSSSVMMDANCQPNQDQYHQSLQQYQSQKYQQQLNSNSLTNSLTTRKEKFKQLDNYENDNIPLEVNNPQLTLQNCVDSSGKDSTTSTIAAADLRTPSDASRTNSSSRSNSINSGEVSSHSGGSCGEGDWESEFCRMDSGKSKTDFAYKLGRKYSDNIVMMSTSAIHRHAPVLTMSVPSSTSSLLNHMVENGTNGDSGDTTGVNTTTSRDDANNDDDDDDEGPLSSNGDDDDDADDDILRNLIYTSPSPPSLISSNRFKSNLNNKPILIEPSTSGRRQSSTPLTFGLRSILTRSFCRRSRREST